MKFYMHHIFSRILLETMAVLTDMLYDPANPDRGIGGRPLIDFKKAVVMTVAYLGSKEITYRLMPSQNSNKFLLIFEFLYQCCY